MKTRYLSYIKQSTLLNVGHIYEHLIITLFEKKAYDNGFLRGVDYDWYAETYDGIVSVSINTNNVKILKVLKDVILKSDIVDEDIHKSINEISCEYNSPFECDFNLLRDEIIKLDKIKWVENNNFLITKPIIKSGWSIKNSPIISFGKTKKADFDLFSFVYNFKNIDFELKPLTMYIAQFLAFSIIDALYNRTPELEACYDKKDEWAEWQFEYNNDLVGYAHYLSVFSKQKMSSTTLKKIFDRNYNEIIGKGFVKKLVKFLAIESKNNYKYFNQKEMVKNSGAIIGKKWFKNYCSEKNINILLKNMEVTIKKEK